MSSHALPAGTLQREQVNQLAQVAQRDATVRPYASSTCPWGNSSVSWRIMGAPSKEALAAWLQRMQMPFKYVTPAEREGERGVVGEA